jgi:hypothetical protein
VDHETLRLVRGNLPTADECRQMGAMTFNNCNGISLKDTKNPFNVLRPTQKPEPATAGAGK